MISFVKGPIAEMTGDCVVIECGNVGYEIFIPLSVFEKLPGVGREVKLYTYFQVREDAMCLYGFLSRQDLKMFKQLISVNGIGPKGALGILSAMDPDDLKRSGDIWRCKGYFQGAWRRCENCSENYSGFKR